MKVLAGRKRSARPWNALGAACLLTCLAWPLAQVRASGRSWAPAERLTSAEFPYMPAARLETSEAGLPLLFSAAYDAAFGPGFIRAFHWADSSWADDFTLRHDPGLLPHVSALPGKQYLLWLDNARIPSDPTGTLHPLFVAEVTGDSIGALDTVAVVLGGDQYAAAASAQRRWAVVVDQSTHDNSGPRILYSDAPNQWHNINRLPKSDYGFAVAAIGDTGALIIWGSYDMLRWGTADAGGLTQAPDPAGLGWGTNPVLRPRASGGFWASWGTYTRKLAIASYDDGQWTILPPLEGPYSGYAYSYLTVGGDLSCGAGEYPSVAWLAEINGVYHLFVSVSTDTGFGPAEELTDAYDAGGPSVARDLNGDAWVSWWTYSYGSAWQHTYTAATGNNLRIENPGLPRRIAWTLSESAPETWWAVLKSVKGGPFLPVARVRAGPTPEMNWTDTAPPAAIVSYKIRRECVDTRYQWESAPVSWPAGARPPIYLGPPHPPGEPDSEPGLVGTPEDRQWGRVRLSLGVPAPGPVILRAYDLQGRLVLEQRVMAPSTERQTVSLDFRQAGRPLSSGIYFARATDAAGNESATVRVVLLR